MFDLEFGHIDPLQDSTSKILRAFPKDQEFTDLNRNEKGFSYEVYVQKLLRANGVEVSGNPIVYREWQNNQVEGYDIRVRLPNGRELKVECKLLLNRIFPSWFERDWLGREADIYVTNDVYAVPYNCRRRLERNGKKLLSTTEFIMYIQKRVRGNKYGYLNSKISNKYRTKVDRKYSVGRKTATKSLQTQPLVDVPFTVFDGNSKKTPNFVLEHSFSENSSMTGEEKERNEPDMTENVRRC